MKTAVSATSPTPPQPIPKRAWHSSCNILIPSRKWPHPSLLSGSKMVVQLLGAFTQLSLRMSPSSSSSESLLFSALKLSIPLLHSLPLLPNSRSPLSRSLSVSLRLSHLHADAELLSASLLFHPLLSNPNSLPFSLLRSRLGPATAHLLHDSLRLSSALSAAAAAADLRRFYLTFYDSRALTLHLAFALDAMLHDLPHLPRFRQQYMSLRALKIYAPLAHALGLNFSLQLEDLSFRCLFPHSYLYLDAWLRTNAAEPRVAEECKEVLVSALSEDESLSCLVTKIDVTGRCKSRYSTMKKLLKDGRRKEEVNDILGLRVVLWPASPELGVQACYVARDVVRRIWKEVSHRSKDYIANPKANGYKSLHMAVDINSNGSDRPLMEVQIRTVEMDNFAVGGAASHSFYKAGLTDPQQAKRLKAIMVAAAELAELRLKDLGKNLSSDEVVEQSDRVFRLLDKNGDGRISIDELKEVMEELGAPGEDASQMMNLLDSNSDGSLSSDEFESFQRQVEFMRSVEDTDDHYKSVLNEKLQFAQEKTSTPIS